MRCPVCRAQVEQGSLCRRCRADLSLLFRLEDERAGALARARLAFARGQWREARAASERADALRSDEDSRQLRALSSLMQRDFGSAWHVYARDRPPGS